MCSSDLAAKVANARHEGQTRHEQFVAEVCQLGEALAGTSDFHAGADVRKAHLTLRRHIDFLHRDRALDGDVRTVCELLRQGAFHPAHTA